MILWNFKGLAVELDGIAGVLMCYRHSGEVATQRIRRVLSLIRNLLIAPGSERPESESFVSPDSHRQVATVDEPMPDAPNFGTVPTIIGRQKALGPLVEPSAGVVEEFWRSASQGELNSAEATIAWSHRIHDLATNMLILSKELKYLAYPELRPEGQTVESEPFNVLQKRVSAAIQSQRKSYPHYSYVHGLPYQSLAIADVFGARETEPRYKHYGLDELLGPTDRILDIGASCGFMSIIAAYRTGCLADCVEHNPHMTDIGVAVAEYLGVSEKVSFYAERFQDWTPPGQYTVIFSFAAHWTDDEGLRPDFRSHMERLRELLSDEGSLIFESHTQDVGSAAFEEKMRNIEDLFSWSESKLLDHNRRELFIMRPV